MADSIAGLSIDLSANLVKLYEGLNQAVAAVNVASGQMVLSLEKTSRSVTDLLTAFQTLGGSLSKIGGLFGVGAFAKLIDNAVEAQAELHRMSERTGATVEALSSLKSAARQSAVAFEDVGLGLARFGRNIVQAQKGTGDTAKALQQLGFDARTFASSFKSTDQAFIAYATAMSKYADSSFKTANAMAVAGRAGQNLIPLFNQIGRVGLTAGKTTDEQAAAADRLEKSFAKLAGSIKGLVTQLANVLVPVLQAVVDHLTIFRDIGIAAAVAFVAWPAILTPLTAAFTAYKEAVIGAALAQEVLGQDRSIISAFLGLEKSVLSLKNNFGSLAALLRTLPALAFAAYAGFKFGEFLQETSYDFQIFGTYVTEVLRTVWENLKAGFQGAWEFVKFHFFSMIEELKEGFGKFVELVGKGLSYLPSLSGISEQVQAFGKSLQEGAGKAAEDYERAMLRIRIANAEAKKDIKEVAEAQRQAYLLQFVVGKGVKKGKPEEDFPGTKAVADLKDATSALNAYNAALASLYKTQADVVGKLAAEEIKSQQTALERSYSQNLISFQDYLNRRNDLQLAANANLLEEAQRNLAIQKQLVAQAAEAQTAFAGRQGEFAGANKTNEFKRESIKLSTDYIKALEAEAKAQGQVDLVMQAAAKSGQDLFEVLQKQFPAIITNNKALVDQIAAQKLSNQTAGLTEAQTQRVIAAKDAEVLATLQATQAYQDGLPAYVNTAQALEEQIRLRNQLAQTLQRGEEIKKYQEAWSDALQTVNDGFRDLFKEIVETGTLNFKKLWDEFKKWALEAIIKVAAQKITLQIAGSLDLGVGKGINVGGGGPLSRLGDLFGGGGGGGLPGGLDIFKLFGGGGSSLFSSFATSGIGQSLGLSEVALGSFADGLAGAGAGLTELGAGIAGMLPALGVVAGIGVAAYAVYQYLESKKGGPKEGGFAAVGVERGSFFPGESTKAGDEAVGKLVDSVQKSFEQALGKLGGKAFDIGFALGFSTDPQGKALSNVHGGVYKTGVGSLFEATNPNVGRTPEDLQAELQHQAQQMLLAALQASELPAAVGKILSSVDVVSASSDQITQIIAVAEAINAVVAAFPALNEQIGALDAEHIQSFITALGGVEQVAQSFAYLQKNFTTTADATEKNANDLKAAFDGLGLAVPQTHQAFTDLLASFDLVSEEGRNLYAAVIALAPAFVAVAGSADEAAKKLQDATAFFQTNFYSDAEKNAAKVAAATAQLNAAQQQLGVVIPRTAEGFRKLVEGIDQTTPAGEALYAALIVLAPAIVDVVGSLNDAAGALREVGDAAGGIGTFGGSDLTSMVENLTEPFKDQISSLAEAASDSLSEQIPLQMSLLASKVKDYQQAYQDALLRGNIGIALAYDTAAGVLQNYSNQLAAHLARYTILTAQYGEAQAKQLLDLEEWYNAQKIIFYGNAAALSALDKIFKDKWDAIIKGTSDGVDGTISNLDKLRKAIQDYLDSLKISDLSPLTPAQKLAEAQSQYQAVLAKAAKGDPTALADITKFADQYLKQARDFYASSPLYTAIFQQITSQLEALVSKRPPPPGSNPTGPGSGPGVTNAVTLVTDAFEAAATGVADTLATGFEPIVVAAKGVAQQISSGFQIVISLGKGIADQITLSFQPLAQAGGLIADQVTTGFEPVKTAGEDVAVQLVQTGTDISAQVTTGFEPLSTVGSGLAEQVSTGFQPLTVVGTGIADQINTGFEPVKSVGQGIAAGVTTGFQPLADVGLGIADQVATGFEPLSTVPADIESAISTGFTPLTTVGGDIAGAVTTGWESLSTVPGHITTAVSTGFSPLATVGGDIAGAVATGWEGLSSTPGHIQIALSSGFAPLIGKGQELSDQIDTGFQPVAAMGSNLAATISTGFQPVSAVGSDLAATISTGFEPVKVVGRGIADQINTGFEPVKSAGKGIAAQIGTGFEPLNGVGRIIADGLTTGFEPVTDAGQNIAPLLTTGFEPLLRKGSDIADQLTTGFEPIAQVGKDIATRINTGFEPVPVAGRDVANGLGAVIQPIVDAGRDAAELLTTGFEPLPPPVAIAPPLSPTLPVAGPGGRPIDLNAALFAALPVTGTRQVSNEDLRKAMESLEKVILSAMAAVADVHDENQSKLTRAITNNAEVVVNGLRGNLK